MADLNLNDYQIVLNCVKSELSGWTHKTIDVVTSATLKNGSVLDDAGVELAVAGAAGAALVIDDLDMRVNQYADGTTISVAVVVTDCVLNEPKVEFSDAALDATGKAALEAKGLRFSSVASV
ncbi:hypothetical protein NVP1170O_014 [Vibrio phage 1.170.O._10N.261.52.C3]|nr:hypothetical protein NVP1170O_014 [Vibrio phage 1.170.O._10N.261.52.C3]